MSESTLSGMEHIVICENCGHKCDAGNSFCENCGAKMADIIPVNATFIKPTPAKVASAKEINSKISEVIDQSIEKISIERPIRRVP